MREWALKGANYECCRTEDGQCGLWFGRDLPDVCTNLLTYQIKEGHIQNVDMKGIIITFHQGGIGPKVADFAKGIEYGAAYVSDNATEEQRKILESFATTDLDTVRWKTNLGVKFVKINISEENGIYHITMPFGEQKMALDIGGDGKNPIRIENAPVSFLTDLKVCTAHWKYHDHGINLEYHNTSGTKSEFAIDNTTPYFIV